jgi:hypothetical protein
MSSKSHHQSSSKILFSLSALTLTHFYFLNMGDAQAHADSELYMFWVGNELKAKFHHSRRHTHFIGQLGRHEKRNAGVVLYYFP